MDAAEAFMAAIERKKQENQNGKIADTIVKTNPEVLDGLGMHPEEFAGMSARDKAATVLGIFQAQGYKKALADVQRAQSAGDLEATKAIAAQGQQEGVERFNQGMQAYQNTPESIRRPDYSNVMRENMFSSGLYPEDAQRYSAAAENMGEMGGFNPGQTVPFQGTDYVYAPLSRRSGTALPRAGLSRSGVTRQPKFEGAGSEPWIVSDDEEEFKRNFLKVKDPAAQEAILALRRAYRLANGKADDPLGLKGFMKPDERGGNAQEQPGFFSRLFGLGRSASRPGQGGGAAGGTAAPGAAKAAGGVRKWNPQTKKFE